MTRTIRSIERSEDVIQTVIARDTASVSELADALEMPLSTMYDYVKTLESLGYLFKLPNDQYKVSSKFLEVGNHVRNQYGIYTVAEPELKALAGEIGEYIPLMVEEDGLGVILSMHRGEKASNIRIRETNPGTRTRLSTTAPGKAILAHLPDYRVRAIVDRYGLGPKTPFTITDADVLADELEAIQEQWYAIDDEERFEGMKGIGVPIDNDMTDVPAAISIYGPTHRLSDEKLHGDLADRLLEVANVIQVNLTYS